MTAGQIPNDVRIGIRRKWLDRLMRDVHRYSIECAVEVDRDVVENWANRLDDIAAELRRVARAREPRPLVPCAACGILSEDIASHRCRP